MNIMVNVFPTRIEPTISGFEAVMPICTDQPHVNCKPAQLLALTADMKEILIICMKICRDSLDRR